MSKHRLILNESHINRGMRKICGACPLALALNDMLNRQAVRVTGVYFSFYESFPGDFLTYCINVTLPAVISNWVYNFDNQDEVYPFEYDVEISEIDRRSCTAKLTIINENN